MKNRDQINDKYKLNIKDLFETEESFFKEIENLYKEIDKIKSYEGKILDNSNNLFELLSLSENIEKSVEKVFVFAHLTNDFDLEDKTGNEYFGYAYKLYQEMGVASAYIIPELLESDYEVVKKFIEENDKLKKYERLLKEIYRSKNHILGKSEELILSKLSEVISYPESAYSKLVDVDLKFDSVLNAKGETIELNESSYKILMESQDRNVRKNTFETFYEGYKNIINTTSELLAANVKKDNEMANLRKYNTALEAALDNNDVDIKVYKTLLNAIEENLDIIYRQWDIRKESLGVDELHLYDLSVPIIKNYEKKYSYEEASELIKEALEVLGEYYSDVLKKAFNENWIDVFPNKNKRSGAYCTCVYKTHPYVLTNYNERYDDVATLAHELGHAMHYYYALENNNYCDYNYTIFVAEVASQVNEALLAFHILNTSSNKEEKICILDELIRHFKSSVIRQTMFAEFEEIIHDKEQNGEILTKENLCNTYYDLNKKYFGNNIVVDDKIKYEWSRVPHFYYNFYVYQYSTGYIAALKIARYIFYKKEGALEKYLRFLSLGATKSPVESLKVAGVDLTDKSVFQEAFLEFNREMDEFEALYKGGVNNE